MYTKSCIVGQSLGYKYNQNQSYNQRVSQNHQRQQNQGQQNFTTNNLSKNTNIKIVEVSENQVTQIQNSNNLPPQQKYQEYNQNIANFVQQIIQPQVQGLRQKEQKQQELFNSVINNLNQREKNQDIEFQSRNQPLTDTALSYIPVKQLQQTQINKEIKPEYTKILLSGKQFNTLGIKKLDKQSTEIQKFQQLNESAPNSLKINQSAEAKKPTIFSSPTTLKKLIDSSTNKNIIKKDQNLEKVIKESNFEIGNNGSSNIVFQNQQFSNLNANKSIKEQTNTTQKQPKKQIIIQEVQNEKQIDKEEENDLIKTNEQKLNMNQFSKDGLQKYEPSQEVKSTEYQKQSPRELKCSNNFASYQESIQRQQNSKTYTPNQDKNQRLEIKKEVSKPGITNQSKQFPQIKQPIVNNLLLSYLSKAIIDEKNFQFQTNLPLQNFNQKHRQDQANEQSQNLPKITFQSVSRIVEKSELQESDCREIISNCEYCQSQIFDGQIQLKCHHNFHQSCFKDYVETQINSGKLQIQCLCSIKIKVTAIKQHLKLNQQSESESELLKKYFEIQLREIRKFFPLISRCQNCTFFWNGRKAEVFKRCFECLDEN